MALYPAFNEAGIPTVEDLAGNDLASIAAAWTLSNEIWYTKDGKFPDLMPMVPIPCE
jgi:hypothetical protein